MGKRTRLAGMLAVLAGFVVFAVGVVSNSSAAGGGGLGSGAVTNYLKYVGGKAGKANPKLSPVQIGFFNQQGGAVVIGADATVGAQMAVELRKQGPRRHRGPPDQARHLLHQDLRAGGHRPVASSSGRTRTST